MKGKMLAVVLLVILAVAIIGAARYLRPAPRLSIPAPGAGVFCTADAKMCPDGSYVGRRPPSCEFAPCPGA
jgi:hypothetical protein